MSPKRTSTISSQLIQRTLQMECLRNLVVTHDPGQVAQRKRDQSHQRLADWQTMLVNPDWGVLRRRVQADLFQ